MAENRFAHAPDQASLDQILAASMQEMLADMEAVGGHAMVVEPFTWGWFGLQIAEGAVAWIGGRILESLFRGTDMAALLRSAIEAIGATVRSAIQENELRLISADLRTLQTEMTHYLAAPSGTDRLANATSSASATVSKLEFFGLAGHGAYMVALSAQIAVLQERAKVFGDGEKANIKSTLQRGIAHAELMRREWREWHERRFEAVHLRVGGPASLNIWIVKRDGENLRTFGREDYARDHLRLNREDIWDNVLVPNYISPSEQIVAKWKELLTVLP